VLTIPAAYTNTIQATLSPTASLQLPMLSMLIKKLSPEEPITAADGSQLTQANMSQAVRVRNKRRRI
jgi:hypothetical protein